jgi:hypothetical protein
MQSCVASLNILFGGRGIQAFTTGIDYRHHVGRIRLDLL